MIMDERFSISNMAVEMGAKVGLMEADETAKTFLREQGIASFEYAMTSDADAVYCQRFDFSAEQLEPMVALPHQVDNVTEIRNAGKVPIHQAYIGSCTGGRYHDLEQAAKILKGKKIAKGLRLLVSPASDQIWKKAAASGILQILAEAGADVMGPTCGVCVGVHSGLLASGENCISSTNRNFLGRMGSKDSKIFLASPMSVAASALTGTITDPREFL